MKALKKVFLLLAVFLLLPACADKSGESYSVISVASSAPVSSENPVLPESSTPEPSPVQTPPLQSEIAQSFVSELRAAGETDSLITVIADETEAVLAFHRKNADGRWEELFSCEGRVAHNGVGQACEGSDTTPQGDFLIGLAFGNSPDPGTALEYTVITPYHYWVDDPDSAYYNRMVDSREVTPDWDSAEHLCESPGAYAYAIDIGYNTDCVPGAGSAMFLHCDIGEPTAGCITVSRENMILFLRNADRATRVIVATQDTICNY